MLRGKKPSLKRIPARRGVVDILAEGLAVVCTRSRGSAAAVPGAWTPNHVARTELLRTCQQFARQEKFFGHRVTTFSDNDEAVLRFRKDRTYDTLDIRQRLTDLILSARLTHQHAILWKIKSPSWDMQTSVALLIYSVFFFGRSFSLRQLPSPTCRSLPTWMTSCRRLRDKGR